jgi:hypothetical protein
MPDEPRGMHAERSACGASTKRGTPCRAWTLPDSDRCFSHDPSRAEERRAARAAGGAKASQLRLLRGRRPRLEEPRQLVRFLGSLILDVLDGRVSAEVGRTCFYGCATLRQTIELGDLAARLEALEAAMSTQAGGTRWRA